MFDTVMDAVLAALAAAGIDAARELDMTPGCAVSTPFVCAGVKGGSLKSSGCGEYLGVSDANGAQTEIYGYRAELELGFSVFAPTAQESAACWDKVCQALGGCPAGLKMRAFICGEAEYDDVSDSIRRDCRAQCFAYLIRETAGEEGEFTDFVLRGAVKV